MTINAINTCINMYMTQFIAQLMIVDMKNTRTILLRCIAYLNVLIDVSNVSISCYLDIGIFYLSNYDHFST